jgi:hypothetical protein
MDIARGRLRRFGAVILILDSVIVFRICAGSFEPLWRPKVALHLVLLQRTLIIVLQFAAAAFGVEAQALGLVAEAEERARAVALVLGRIVWCLMDLLNRLVGWYLKIFLMN